MEYRKLIALQTFRHDGFDVQAGGEFLATPVDAGYLITRGKAKDAAVKFDRQEPVAVVAEPVAEPVKEETVYVYDEVEAIAVEPEVPEVVEPAIEEEAAPEVPAPRRRGRPRKA